jgi:hypothetical protein
MKPVLTAADMQLVESTFSTYTKVAAHEELQSMAKRG